MDISNLFKGQKLDGECPKCNTPYTVDASKAFSRTNNRIRCSGCGTDIVFNNAEAIQKVEGGIRDIKRTIKRKFR